MSGKEKDSSAKRRSESRVSLNSSQDGEDDFQVKKHAEKSEKNVGVANKENKEPMVKKAKVAATSESDPHDSEIATSSKNWAQLQEEEERRKTRHAGSTKQPEKPEDDSKGREITSALKGYVIPKKIEDSSKEISRFVFPTTIVFGNFKFPDGPTGASRALNFFKLLGLNWDASRFTLAEVHGKDEFVISFCNAKDRNEILRKFKDHVLNGRFPAEAYARRHELLPTAPFAEVSNVLKPTCSRDSEAKSQLRLLHSQLEREVIGPKQYMHEVSLLLKKNMEKVDDF